MTTETKVEAVAWQRREHSHGEWGFIPKWSYDKAMSAKQKYPSSAHYDLRELVPQSALDALLGEVEDLKAQLARKEHSHGQTIDDRDRAEEALGDIFMAVTGREAEWSSAWDYADAIQEVEEHMSTLTKESP